MRQTRAAARIALSPVVIAVVALLVLGSAWRVVQAERSAAERYATFRASVGQIVESTCADPVEPGCADPHAKALQVIKSYEQVETISAVAQTPLGSLAAAITAVGTVPGFIAAAAIAAYVLADGWRRRTVQLEVRLRGRRGSFISGCLTIVAILYGCVGLIWGLLLLAPHIPGAIGAVPSARGVGYGWWAWPLITRYPAVIAAYVIVSVATAVVVRSAVGMMLFAAVAAVSGRLVYGNHVLGGISPGRWIAQATTHGQLLARDPGALGFPFGAPGFEWDPRLSELHASIGLASLVMLVLLTSLVLWMRRDIA